MNERDTYFQLFAERVAAKLKEEDLLNIGNHMRPLSDPPLDFDYERAKEIIVACTRDFAMYVLRSAIEEHNG